MQGLKRDAARHGQDAATGEQYQAAEMEDVCADGETQLLPVGRQSVALPPASDVPDEVPDQPGDAVGSDALFPVDLHQLVTQLPPYARGLVEPVPAIGTARHI